MIADVCAQFICLTCFSQPKTAVDKPDLVPMLCKCCGAVFLGWQLTRTPLQTLTYTVTTRHSPSKHTELVTGFVHMVHGS